jgi:hypothetical protein
MKHYRINGFRFDATVLINDWSFIQYVTTQLRNFASSSGYGSWVTRKVSAGGAF